MRRVKILVEGQTEEVFINRLLGAHLAQHQVHLTPILLTTKRVKNRNLQERAIPGRSFKGGVSTYHRVKVDVRNVLEDKQAIVSTMIDFYGLPNDFPGKDRLPAGNSNIQVRYLEQAFAEDINSSRFRPFFTLHEFEALLFSRPEEIAGTFPEAKAGTHFMAIPKGFSSPEEINQGRDTHPAARILAHLPDYNKPFHGVLIAQRIGLEAIRQECDHFAEWVAWLESLGI